MLCGYAHKIKEPLKLSTKSFFRFPPDSFSSTVQTEIANYLFVTNYVEIAGKLGQNSFAHARYTNQDHVCESVFISLFTGPGSLNCADKWFPRNLNWKSIARQQAIAKVL